jgi:hypothetical protein
MLGKVLACLNILVTLLLGVLIALDYGKRQSWAYSVFRHDLAIQGMPLNKEELGPDGKPLVNDLGKQTQQDIFGQVGGPPAGGPTQVDEVAAVEQKVQAKIQEAGEDKVKQLAASARFLAPLAISNAQREEYLACKTHLANEASIKQLKQQLSEALARGVEIRRRSKNRKLAEAFDEGLRYVRGEPTQPFARAFVKALSKEPDEKIDQLLNAALGALPPNPQQQQLAAAQLRILQGLRGADAAGKNWSQLIDETFDETINSLAENYKTQLDSTFQEAKTGQRAAKTEGGETKKSEAEEQRQIIARLLLAMVGPLAEEGAGGGGQPGAAVELDQTQEFRRFVTVVGLEHAVHAINENAQTLARIAYELSVDMERERGDFAASQQEFLALVQDEASRYGSLKSLLDHKRAQANQQQELVRQREMEIQKLQNEIAQARQATAAKREELKKMSQALFELRLQMRDATARNQELEKTIRGLEEGR